MDIGGNTDSLNSRPPDSAAGRPRRSSPVVRRLIERGADVNAVNNGRSTPLMSAAVHDHAEVVQILLRAGASPSDRVLDAVVLVGATGAERVLREWRVAAGQTG